MNKTEAKILEKLSCSWIYSIRTKREENAIEKLGYLGIVHAIASETNKACILRRDVQRAKQMGYVILSPGIIEDITPEVVRKIRDT